MLLDSDKIIPNYFIEKTLKYFNKNNIRIVQANHKRIREENLFDTLEQKGVCSARTIFIFIKNNYSVVALNGHGAMIKKMLSLNQGVF